MKHNKRISLTVRNGHHAVTNQPMRIRENYTTGEDNFFMGFSIEYFTHKTNYSDAHWTTLHSASSNEDLQKYLKISQFVGEK